MSYNYYIENYGALEAIERQYPELKEKLEVQIHLAVIKAHTQALEDLIFKLEEAKDEQEF